MKYSKALESHPNCPTGRRQFTTIAALGRYAFPSIADNRMRTRAAMILLIRAGFVELSALHITDRRVSAVFSLHAKAGNAIIAGALAASAKISYDQLPTISPRECDKAIKKYVPPQLHIT